MLWAVNGSSARICCSSSQCYKKGKGKSTTPCALSHDALSQVGSKHTLQQDTCTANMRKSKINYEENIRHKITGDNKSNNSEGDDASNESGSCMIIVDVTEEDGGKDNNAAGLFTGLKSTQEVITLHGSQRHHRQRPLQFVLFMVWTWLCMSLVWAILGTMWLRRTSVCKDDSPTLYRSALVVKVILYVMVAAVGCYSTCCKIESCLDEVPARDLDIDPLKPLSSILDSNNFFVL